MLQSKRYLCCVMCFASIMLSCGALAVMSLFSINKWVGVGVGIGIFAVSAVLLFTVKKPAYIPISIANSIAIGIAISSVYTHYNCFPEVWKILLVGVGSAAAFALFCLLTFIPFVKKHYMISAIAFSVIIITFEALATAFLSLPVFSIALFMLLTVLGFVIVISAEAFDVQTLIKNITFMTFSALILAIIIAVIILTEGEGADALSGDVGGFGSKRKRADPYSFNFDIV